MIVAGFGFRSGVTLAHNQDNHASEARVAEVTQHATQEAAQVHLRPCIGNDMAQEGQRMGCYPDPAAADQVGGLPYPGIAVPLILLLLWK